jgi:hypothetical protein
MHYFTMWRLFGVCCCFFLIAADLAGQDTGDLIESQAAFGPRRASVVWARAASDTPGGSPMVASLPQAGDSHVRCVRIWMVGGAAVGVGLSATEDIFKIDKRATRWVVGGLTGAATGWLFGLLWC